MVDGTYDEAVERSAEEGRARSWSRTCPGPATSVYLSG